MHENPEELLISVDMRGRSIEADCIDCLVAFPAAIERMRSTADVSAIPESMN